jgi:hypothetical protein
MIAWSFGNEVGEQYTAEEGATAFPSKEKSAYSGLALAIVRATKGKRV